MTLRLKLVLGLALAAFAVCHVAAAYRIEATTGQGPDVAALHGD
jgi:hypothetical protein